MIKEIGDRLKEARKKKGFQQIDLAEKLKITRQALSRMETGRVELTTKNLVKIADILDISLDWLIFGKEEQTEQGFFSPFGKYASTVETMFFDIKEDQTMMHALLSAWFELKAKELSESQKQKEKEENG